MKIARLHAHQRVTHPSERSLAKVKKLKEPRKKVNPKKPLNGETLQAAVTWAIGRKVFSGLKVHGNTVWRMTELVVLAVVWVWSDQKTLTGAFQEANRWTIDVFGRSVLGTYQGM